MKIDLALIDPKWEWGTCAFGDVTMPFITVHHPVHGAITSLVPPPVLETMVQSLTEILAKNATKQ